MTENEVRPPAAHTLYLNDEQLAIVLDAVRNWDNTLGGRFALIEPWEWLSSRSPDEKSYKKALDQCLSLLEGKTK